jgi:hypothetical protein
MATGLAKSADAAKTMGRGRPERWLLLSNRSLFHWADGSAPWGSFKGGPLHGEVGR